MERAKHSEIDILYYQECPHCLAITINEFPFITLATAPQTFKKVTNDITGGFNEAIHPDLFKMYSDNYHKAISSVLGDPGLKSKYFEHAAKFKLNTSRLAAHKAAYATERLQHFYKKNPAEFAEKSKSILKAFNRWQATEYNTAVNRTRTAKQFIQFGEEKELYPNLEWLATRSAIAREEHQRLVGLVLPQDDPFWQDNQPGNLYSCKCDWKTTDAPVSDIRPKGVEPHKGLDGNPADTGDIFTEKHPYYEKINKSGKKELVNLFYQDTVGKFDISAIADKREIADNVATARIIKSNMQNINIKINSHVKVKGRKNPEFLINGQLADAKRLEVYNGITSGFNKAVNRQKCKVVIIDFNKNFDTSKSINVDIVTGLIMRRKEDFINGVSCHIVYGEKSFFIDIQNFIKHKIAKGIKGIMPDQ